MSAGIRCAWMRGGTSKAAMFLAEDLPADAGTRDELLLRIMGSPDPRQIDGIGGAASLTSKVGVVRRSQAPGIDVEYLFLQVGVDEPTVSDRQNCGNILAAVGPFALERGLVVAADGDCSVTILQVNSGDVAVATFPVSGGRPVYDGDTAVSGVPGRAAPVRLTFSPAGRNLFPTGSVRDEIDGIAVTCVDAGMPVVVVEADDLGITGAESPTALRTDATLRARVDRLRQRAGRLMGLGDTAGATVPKTMAVSDARDGGDLSVRSFIPVLAHEAVGVVASFSAVAGMGAPGAVGHERMRTDRTGVDLEHPSGHLLLDVDLVRDPELSPVEGGVRLRRASLIRTARMLFDGVVYPTAAVASGTATAKETNDAACS